VKADAAAKAAKVKKEAEAATAVTAYNTKVTEEALALSSKNSAQIAAEKPTATVAEKTLYQDRITLYEDKQRALAQALEDKNLKDSISLAAT